MLHDLILGHETLDLTPLLHAWEPEREQEGASSSSLPLPLLLRPLLHAQSSTSGSRSGKEHTPSLLLPLP